MTKSIPASALSLPGATLLALAAIASLGWPAAAAPICPGTKECPALKVPKVSEDPALPHYRPAPGMAGRIRIFGSDMGGQVDAWIAEFRKSQPNIVFETKYPTSDGAASGLVAGDADIGSAGREAMLSEFLAFQETFGYELAEAAVATGSYNVRGKTPSVVIYVNQANPIAHLTVDQLDGIFGSERSGGYRGYHFITEVARGPNKNIRTWRQLGIANECRDQPIRTYGYAFSGMTEFFNRVVLKGGDKWNPNYSEQVESFTKMVPHGDFGPGSSQWMLERIAHDKCAIGWSFIPAENRMRFGGVKPVAIGTRPGGPFYAPNLQNTLSRKYPLARSVFFYLKNDPKTGLKPEVAEFMRFIYSREGQAVVASRQVYLPLPAETATRQLAAILPADQRLANK